MNKNVIFVFYGEGGHKAQIERLLNNFYNLQSSINYIGFAEGKAVSNKIKNYHLVPMWSKSTKFSLFFMMPFAFIVNIFTVLFFIFKYNPKGIISTGPGSVIFPAVLCKLLRKKIVYVETWSRFTTKSFTGKFMYLLADKFYVQNLDLLALYPKAVYSGLL